MNQLARLFLCGTVLCVANAEAADQRVQDFVLDDHTVYTVPISGARVTTISFPSPISAIDAEMLPPQFVSLIPLSK